MSIRDIYEHILIELNKVQAPALLLDDFNYFLNKGLQYFFNKRYQLFESTQQLTDDLRVFTKTVKLIPQLEQSANVFDSSYRVELPNDYVHILNCICEITDHKPKKKCDGDSITYQIGANKVNTNQWPHLIENHYMKPSVKRPYYYIINVEDPRSIGTPPDSEKTITRYGNTTIPVMEVKIGDSKNFSLDAVYVDYLRAPEFLNLTEEDLDEALDSTKVIDLPDYVAYDLISEIVTLIMENNSNPRIQTFPAVTTTTQMASGK